MALQKKILMAFDWYDTSIHEGVANYAREHGWFLNTHMARTGQFPIGWDGDGIVALASTDKTLNYLKSLDLPTVDMGGHFPDFQQVLGDHHQTGVMAAEHFLERNHKHFVFFHVQNSRLEKEISTGFIQTLNAAGYECEEASWKKTAATTEHEIRYHDVQKWISEAFARLPRPLAVFCQNDDTAALILTAALEAGCSIPEEVAILGTGNSELICKNLPVALSSIGANLKGHGYTLAKTLDAIMEGRRTTKAPIRIEPGRIHVRKSTDFLAVTNPHVLTVLREIWKNYDQPLNIDVLQKLVPISRSGLYNAFIEDVGRPMGKELTRIRILKAKEMLADTNLQATEIGERCGFNSLISFSRAFSQNTGMSPLHYRNDVRRHLKADTNVEK
ncbi:DNA-binding transcriptional regulator [Coraliomargarita sp. SDUM461004]|uniref:DNA-binding transcriptional regulator n=1 Tax=Thalassobacterium sedimentorum TaxID=3041258 RepID=A0ABU1ALJ4_9BACT|nr:DNA-binding transcriptional regulator [Coraliomargarita sp. SDUM461004]MDQ8194725.1 DNA-binding transcriptional regulator [Coraliomargarita sp. SDUM461004]